MTDVKIKPLDWDGDNYTGWCAPGVGIEYLIDDETGAEELFVLSKIEGASTFKSAHQSLHEAQKFAQDDHESRIRSALL